MKVCLINQHKRYATLDKMETEGRELDIDYFAQLTGVDASNWARHCPEPNCHGELRVVLESENTYTLWCGLCGWLPEDGFDIPLRSIHVSEAARIAGVAETTMTAAIKNGHMPGWNRAAGSGEINGSWYVPLFAMRLIEQRGYKWYIVNNLMSNAIQA